jgi:DNA polymerase
LRPVYDLLNAGPRNRFTVMTSRGPLLVHNCGYEGGVGAYMTMGAVYNFDPGQLVEHVKPVTDGATWRETLKSFDWFKKKGLTYGLPVEHWAACRVLVDAWREAHPNTKALWSALKDAYIRAVAHRGETVAVGKHLKVRADGAWLRIRLPSGRYLCYLSPEVDDEGGCSFMGVDQYSRQWKRIRTHGGKLVENVTQAAARDVLFANMPAIEAEGYEIVLSVHDELLSETPDTEAFSHERLAALMSTVPQWAPGLPLAAAGFETYRYRKD